MAFNVDPKIVGQLPAVVRQPPGDADSKYNGSRPSPFGGKQHTWQWVFDIGNYSGSSQSKSCTPGLTTGQLMVVNTDQMPDYWMVSAICAAAAGAQIGIYLGPAQSGPPIRIGSGGAAKILANGQNFLTVVNLGSQTVFGTVIALGGPDADQVTVLPSTVA